MRELYWKFHSFISILISIRYFYSDVTFHIIYSNLNAYALVYVKPFIVVYCLFVAKIAIFVYEPKLRGNGCQILTFPDYNLVWNHRHLQSM